ncbi:hypothetical protein [Nocardia amamiensis]|uniref:hypothetical protein n=1 Tax=Nocardia amamiensis TaxID=404578 RepID=UPI00082EAD7B|nr:hypothetical protein [Nocardia amamiensis]
MTAVLEPLAAAASTASFDREALAAEMAARTADVAAAALSVIDAADYGQLGRLMSAAANLRSEVDILIGALGPAARAGITIHPADAGAALQATLPTAIYTADLERAYLP